MVSRHANKSSRGYSRMVSTALPSNPSRIIARLEDLDYNSLLYLYFKPKQQPYSNRDMQQICTFIGWKLNTK